ncbi:muconolactone Delta-isomerase [Dietzia sp.]|uniref:muconolactone Delta-isomerase n=1 Tax=Dietzia sp. TaxID=1871616 RepID=UPI002FD98EE9
MALFHVRMNVNIPADLDPALREETVAREKAYSQKVQREGKLLEIWRIAGKYSNISIFEVDSADELNEILFALPLFPYMDIEVTALARHSSDIK